MASAIWMHGTAAQAEEPGRMRFVLKRGWGTHFAQSGGSNWIHIPVGQSGLTMAVNVVFVLYRTDGAVITALHLHDGFTIVKAFEGLSRSGDRLLNNDLNTAQNAWPMDTMIFSSGLGVSLQVQFDSGGGEILIAAAGAYID